LHPRGGETCPLLCRTIRKKILQSWFSSDIDWRIVIDAFCVERVVQQIVCFKAEQCEPEDTKQRTGVGQERRGLGDELVEHRE
jgi:hypothetical protein